jgi:hypothetical protein
MAVIEIPVTNQYPAYSFQVELEGVLYLLDFHYNSRMERWIMSIYSESNDPVLMGIPLLTGWSHIGSFQTSLKPPGEFLCIDEGSLGRNPDRENFGVDVKLVYVESEE